VNTIWVKDFDEGDLPAWARRSPSREALLWCAQWILSFRCDLAYGERSAQWRKALEKRAEWIYSARRKNQKTEEI
jgi:hypothetical protein